MAAETKIQFTEEEVGQIQNLLGSLKGDPDGKDFSPMVDQFKADLDSVKSILEPESDAPAEADAMVEPDGDFLADEMPTDFGATTEPSAADADLNLDFGDEAGLSDAPLPDESLDMPSDSSAEGAGDFDFGSMNLDAPAAEGGVTEGGPADEGMGLDTGAGPGLADDLGAFGADLGRPDAGTTDFGADEDLGSGDDLGAGTEDLGTLGDDTLGLSAEPSAGSGLDADLGSDFGLTSGGDLGGGDLGGDLGGGDLGGDLGGGDLGGDLGGGDLGGDLGGGDLGGDLGGGDLGGGLADDDLGLPAEPSVAQSAAPEAAPEDELGLDFAGLGDDFATDLGSGGPEATAVPTTMAGGAVEELAADLGSITDSGELAAMTEQSQMDQGIGDEFTDEELARIRTNLNDYPPGIRKSAIDAIVSEKVSRPDQRLLVNMIADQAQPESIADFLESRLGYRPDIAPSSVRKDGIQIIYADQVSPEDMAARRRRAKAMIFMASAAVLAVMLAFSGYYFYRTFFVRGMYERGLGELAKAREAAGDEREEHKKRAEELFQKAKDADGGVHSIDYLNRYGIAYMKAGYYEDAFVKLYGRVKPDYGQESAESAWNKEGQRAPLIRKAEGSSFPSPSDEAGGKRAILTARDNVMRTVEIPGAYIVSRLRDGQLDRQNVLALARFHSNRAGSFVRNADGQKYKNDGLAIDCYRLILTLMNRPDDAEAMAGIGDVYYNRKDFGTAAREYNRILERHPMEVSGHAGLLNTYIEIWKADGDPRLVIARHRLARAQGIEDKLPIYLLAKLAAFYTELDRDDVRIKYQVDPVDAVSGLDLQDNAAKVLEILFSKKEKRDEEVIEGSHYGEGFYRRGMFLLAQKESQRALRQFQNAHQYDPHHYLAVNAMGEYYKSIKDYGRAEQYFSEAVKTYKRYHEDYGRRPEDETLEQGDFGKLYYNLGSLVFLRYAGLPEESTEGFRDTRVYPDRAIRPESPDMRKRREQLVSSREYFQNALEEGLKDEKARLDSIFWMGWIDYISADFTGALDQWETIENGVAYSDPVMLMGKANAYFYTDQMRTALGSYLKLESDLERESMIIGRPDPSNSKHRRLYLNLAAVYNNIGAIYEREYLEGMKRGLPPSSLNVLEKNALLSYWHAVDASRKVELDNEVARSNIQLAFKPMNQQKEHEPLLDDWVPPVLTVTDKEKKR